MTAEERDQLVNICFTLCSDANRSRVLVVLDTGHGSARTFFFDGTIEHLPQGGIIWFDDPLK